jgi:glycosyltransferase involved in cell wall biosynthesis
MTTALIGRKHRLAHALSPPVIVCVCTNRSPAAVAPSLDALRAQKADVLVVASGVPPADHGPGVTVLHEPRPGLSRARNRALLECADDVALAFVDDDALVGPGWLAALRDAWDRAPATVACIGGPIRPRFEGARPSWLSDRLLPVLTTLDYGPDGHDLDPFVTTVYGANVSFRAGPLRDAGGFEPGLGHGGRRTGFGEEDEAERALARAGFVVRYEPGPWVEHVIPARRTRPSAFLLRRLQYGAGLGARGGRTPARAARQLASSAAGAPLAALRGDAALTMERATRVAENAGVLLAPVLTRR